MQTDPQKTIIITDPLPRLLLLRSIIVKAELASKIMKYVECSKKVVQSNETKKMIIIEFMGYARKFPVEKLKL